MSTFLASDFVVGYPTKSVKTKYCKIAQGVETHISVEEIKEGKFEVIVVFSLDGEEEVEEVKLDTLVTLVSICAYDTLIAFGFASLKQYRENAVENLLGGGLLRAERYNGNIQVSLDHLGYSGRKDVPESLLQKYITPSD